MKALLATLLALTLLVAPTGANPWLMILGQPASAGASCSVSRDTHAGDSDSPFDNTDFTRLATDFVAGASTTICALEVEIRRVGSPAGTITASIWSESVDAPGTLVGSASATVTASTLGTSMSAVSFTGLSASITSGTTYFLVLEFSAAGTGSDYVQWQYYSGAGASGREIDFYDGSWGGVNDLQFGFQLYSSL